MCNVCICFDANTDGFDLFSDRWVCLKFFSFLCFVWLLVSFSHMCAHSECMLSVSAAHKLTAQINVSCLAWDCLCYRGLLLSTVSKKEHTLISNAALFFTLKPQKARHHLKCQALNAFHCHQRRHNHTPQEWDTFLSMCRVESCMFCWSFGNCSKAVSPF